jgi:hypothetical protein
MDMLAPQRAIDRIEFIIMIRHGRTALDIARIDHRLGPQYCDTIDMPHLALAIY